MTADAKKLIPRVKRLPLLIRLGTAKVSALAKNDHGRSAQYAKMGYGSPVVGMRKNFEKTTVNISIKDNG